MQQRNDSWPSADQVILTNAISESKADRGYYRAVLFPGLELERHLVTTTLIEDLSVSEESEWAWGVRVWGPMPC